MNTKTKAFFTVVLGLGLAGIILSGCQQGPAEELGEKIDNGVQNTKDAARDLKDEITKKK